MLLQKIGNKNFALLHRLMDLQNASHRVHAQNIANVNTPNYRRRELRFDEALTVALEEGTAEAYAGIEGYVARPNTTQVRNNGNNVDIDMEVLAMQENSAKYQMFSQIYHKQSSLVKAAIRGVR